MGAPYEIEIVPPLSRVDSLLLLWTEWQAQKKGRHYGDIAYSYTLSSKLCKLKPMPRKLKSRSNEIHTLLDI